MVRDIIKKCKRTKCIGNLFDRGRKENTTATDRTIQRILKKDRRRSPEKVATEIKKQLDISLIGIYQNQNFWDLDFGFWSFGFVVGFGFCGFEFGVDFGFWVWFWDLGFGCSLDFNLVMENYSYRLVKLLGDC